MRLTFFAVLLAALFTAFSAKADINYTFIKMNCDKASQTLTLGFPKFLHHEDPDEVVAKIRSGKITDMYYFDDLANSGKKITCNLGSNSTVSFSASQSLEHPRDDNLWIFDDRGNTIHSWFFNTNGQKLEIHALGDNSYDIIACMIRFGYPSFKKGECRYKHVVDGKMTEQSQHQATKE